MSKKENKNLRDWLKGNAEMPSNDIDSIWELSGKYKSGYHPDVEEGLSRLKARIDQSKQTPKVIPMKSNRRTFLRIAAAVVFILAIGFTWKTFLSESRINEITQIDQQKEIFLADGTLVVLNQNSKLEYPESFTGGQRKVKLTGEAYFKVAHNPEKPFLITTPESTVKVLGTSFNLRAYPSEQFTEVEVESGKVAFSANNSSSRLLLTANEKGVYHHNQKLEKQMIPFTNAQAWRTGDLRFKDLELSEAINLVERRYKVTVQLQKSLSACSFTSNFDEDTTIDEVFSSMEKILPVRIVKNKDGEYQITGTACK